MGDNLNFLAQLATERAGHLRDSLQRQQGRGSSLAGALLDACSRVEASVSAALQAQPSSTREEDVLVRNLLRAKQQLDVIYVVVSHFSEDVGRRDLPVGLLYLVDGLIQDLLPKGADPLIHLDSNYMYSTLPIVERMPGILNPKTIPEPHPVVFNLPRLDPVNALFSPILAHEIGHTSWRQGIETALQSQIDHPAIKTVMDKAVGAGADPGKLVSTYHSWCQELMCDVLAATLTGPSFLFASAVFLPGPAHGAMGTHPYPRDRVAVTLRVLDRYGWTGILNDHASDVLEWCEELAANPQLNGDAAETALRSAMRIVEPAMISVAEAQCVNRLRAEDFAAVGEVLFEHLALQIPPVSLGDVPVTPWLIVGGTWIHEVSEVGPSDRLAALPHIATDARRNRFILKTIELAAINKLWGAGESATQ